MKRFTHRIILLIATSIMLLSVNVLSAQVLDHQQADELMKQGEYVKALGIYKEIYAKNSSNLDATLDLARVYMALRNHEEAEKYFEIATRDQNCPAEAFQEYGDMLVLNAKYDEARTVYFTYAVRGGDPNVARIRIFSCDSAYAISMRPPLFSVTNERRLSTRYSEFGMSPANNGNFFVFASDRPIDYKSTDAEEMQGTLAMLQGASDDQATLLLLRNAQMPTDVKKFNEKSLTGDTLNVVHSMYEGAIYDLTTEKERTKRQAREKKERKQLEKSLKDKKDKTYGGTGRPFLNMYVTSIQLSADNPGGGVLGRFVWTAPVLLWDPFNVGEHVGPCAFTPDGNAIYFSFAEELRDSELRSGSVSHVGIMISHKDGLGGWSEPVSFPYNNRSRYSVGHPCISKDGRTLYFSSDMPGTIGGMDIFKCELQPDGSWGNPVNLGPVINTIRDEAFPAQGPDGELYFSSDGHPGLGGLDIFKAIGKEDEWTRVENLRKPMNSSADDFSFTFLPDSKTQGIFSSNRSGGYGDDDVYSFKIMPVAPPKPEPKDKPFILVTVLNRADSTPIEGAQLTLMNVKTKKGAVETSDAAGKVLFTVASNLSYDLSAQASGFMPAAIAGIKTTKLKAGESIKLVLPMDKLKVGGTFDVKNVYYDYGKAVLKKAAFKELNKVVKFMKENPKVKIELGSHTDARGGLAGNMKLSQQRAQACITYLKKKGIAANRMKAKGYGPTKLLVKKAKTEKQHAKNRRTEVKILSVD